jgi:hypothetical protein
MIVSNFNLVRIVLLPAEADAPPVIYGAARKVSTSRHHEACCCDLIVKPEGFESLSPALDRPGKRGAVLRWENVGE